MFKVPIVIKPLLSLEELSRDLQLTRQSRYKKLKRAEEETREIIERVMEEGDRALRYYTKKFDGCDIRKWLVEEKELQNSWKEMDKGFSGGHYRDRKKGEKLSPEAKAFLLVGGALHVSVGRKMEAPAFGSLLCTGREISLSFISSYDCDPCSDSRSGGNHSSYSS